MLFARHLGGAENFQLVIPAKADKREARRAAAGRSRRDERSELSSDFALILARHPREGGDPVTLLIFTSNAFAFGEFLFFGRAQRKVTKRKGASPIKAHSPNGCRRDFSKGHPCPLEKRRTSCAAPFGSMDDVAPADL